MEWRTKRPHFISLEDLLLIPEEIGWTYATDSSNLMSLRMILSRRHSLTLATNLALLDCPTILQGIHRLRPRVLNYSSDEHKGKITYWR